MAYLGQTSSYIDTTRTAAPQRDAERFNGDGATTNFTLTRVVSSPTDINVVVENILQEPTIAYSVNGSTLAFTEAPPPGTYNIYVIYRNSGSNQQVTLPDGSVSYNKLANNLRLFTTDNLIPDGSTVAFTLSEAPADANTVMVTVDGIVQRAPVHYNTSGSTITFTSAPSASSNVHVRHLGFRTSTTVTGIGVNTFIPQPNIASPTVSGTSVFECNSAGAAVRITQLGSGNALVVEDSTNPDGTPFVIDSVGRIINGTTASQGALFGGGYNPQIQVWGVGPATTSQSFASFNTAGTGNGSRMWLSRSRGTLTSGVPTYGIVSSGDTLGDIQFAGDDGTVSGKFVTGARIYAEVDGTPGTDDMPGRLVFSTTADGASSPTERMRIDSSGNVGIGTSSPSTKLQVNGQTRISDGTTNIDLVCASSIGYIGTQTNAPLVLRTNDTEQARIDTDGLLKFNSGYGSVATAYGCRAWVNFNGVGTPAVRGSGNVSTIGDNGLGDYTINFSSAMPDVNYSVSGSTSDNSASATNAYTVTTDRYNASGITTGAVRIRIAKYSAGKADNQDVNVSVFR